jgi:hypothetical protein
MHKIESIPNPNHLNALNVLNHQNLQTELKIPKKAPGYEYGKAPYSEKFREKPRI